jgi:uncharacterized protein (DUF362 family)
MMDGMLGNFAKSGAVNTIGIYAASRVVPGMSALDMKKSAMLGFGLATIELVINMILAPAAAAPPA